MSEDKEKENEEKFRRVLDTSSAQVRNLQVSFLIFLCYVAIIGWQTTHVMLLKDSPVNLPVFNVQMPLNAFYWVAPLLIIIYHLDLLLHLNEHAATLRKWWSSGGKSSDRELLFPFAFNYVIFKHDKRLINIAFKTITLALSIAMPLAVLLLLQVKYLPYHSDTVTRFHAAIVVADFAMAIYCWRLISNDGEEWKLWTVNDPVSAPRISRFRFAHYYVALAVIIAISLLVVKIPENKDDNSILKIMGIDDRLRIHEEILYKAPPDIADEKLFISKGNSAEKSWLQQAKGLDLSKRDLNFSYFDKVTFVNVDLRGAKLHKAKFDEVVFLDSRGAQLQQAELYGAGLSQAELYGADLSHAKLHGADLSHAKLHGADLSHAKLHGADLSGAVLHGANLRQAELYGADLSHAKLHGADLSQAELHGADLSHAKLHGADLSVDELLLTLNATIPSNFKKSRVIDTTIGGNILNSTYLSGAILPPLERMKGVLAQNIKYKPFEEWDKIIQSGSEKLKFNVKNAMDFASRMEDAKMRDQEPTAEIKFDNDTAKFTQINIDLACKNAYIANRMDLYNSSMSFVRDSSSALFVPDSSGNPYAQALAKARGKCPDIFKSAQR